MLWVGAAKSPGLWFQLVVKVERARRGFCAFTVRSNRSLPIYHLFSHDSHRFEESWVAGFRAQAVLAIAVLHVCAQTQRNKVPFP